VLWLGGLFVLQEKLTSVHYLHLFYLLSVYSIPCGSLRKFTAIQAGFTAVERLSDILNEPIEIRDPDEEGSREWSSRGKPKQAKFDLNTSGLPTKTTITLLKT